MSLKVDLHTHILPEKWPNLKEKYGYGGWIYMDHKCYGKKAGMVRDSGGIFRIVETNCWSSKERIKDMNRTGVDVQVLSTVPVMFSYWAKPEDTLDLSRLLNDHIASVVRSEPKRFVGMGTLPMQAPLLAVEELKRCATTLNLKAIQIGSHINEWNLDSRHLDPIYKTAEDLGCPLFIHPWDMETTGRMSKYWLPWLVGMPSETSAAICSVIFGGVLEKFPRLKICFAHGAGSFPYTVGRIQHGFEVRPDLCAVENKVSPVNYLGRIYSDSLVHSKEALDLLIDVLGEDQVILGSDYPFPLGESHPGSLIKDMNKWSQQKKAKILGKNALKFLGMDHTDLIK